MEAEKFIVMEWEGGIHPIRGFMKGWESCTSTCIANLLGEGAEVWVGEAVWGGRVVFELLFSKNHKYPETPRVTGRHLPQHPVFEFGRTLFRLLPFGFIT